MSDTDFLWRRAPPAETGWYYIWNGIEGSAVDVKRVFASGYTPGEMVVSHPHQNMEEIPVKGIKTFWCRVDGPPARHPRLIEYDER